MDAEVSRSEEVAILVQRELQNSKSFKTPAGVGWSPGKKRGKV
jgi:hypothetical protein